MIGSIERMRWCATVLGAAAIGLTLSAPAGAQRISLQQLLERIEALESALAEQQCPPGQFVRGFDLSRRIVCGEPGGAGAPGDAVPVPLEVGQTVQAFLNGLVGNELAGVFFPVDQSLPIGRFTANVQLAGFAACSPSDPSAAPNPAPSPGTTVLGCANDAVVTATASLDRTRPSVLACVPAIFSDLPGDWALPPENGDTAGFAGLGGATVTLRAPLTEAGPGPANVGPIDGLDIAFASSAVHVELNGASTITASLWNAFLPLLTNALHFLPLYRFQSRIRDAVLDPVLQAANSIPVP